MGRKTRFNSAFFFFFSQFLFFYYFFSVLFIYAFIMFIQSCFSFTSKALHFPHHLPSIILSLTISLFFLPLFALFIGFLHLHSLVYIGVKILSFPLHFVDLFVQFRSPSFFFAIIRSFSPCHILSFLFFFTLFILFSPVSLF